MAQLQLIIGSQSKKYADNVNERRLVRQGRRSSLSSKEAGNTDLELQDSTGEALSSPYSDSTDAVLIASTESVFGRTGVILCSFWKSVRAQYWLASTVQVLVSQ